VSTAEVEKQDREGGHNSTGSWQKESEERGTGIIKDVFFMDIKQLHTRRHHCSID